MPWQLIYTSAPRGLLSGQTGFCTVARSGDLREALAQRLEQLSYYHYLRVAEATVAGRNPTVCAFRILDLRGAKYHVLTRIQPCGLDFTARTNHLAHHLVFQGDELNRLPSPAAILRYWDGWMSAWQGEPRVLPDPPVERFGAAAQTCLPAQTWLQVTGDAGRAAGLLEGECVRGCYLVCPPASEQQVLAMYCETLQLLNLKGEYPLRPWRHSFTTFLQAEDNPADFVWRACQEGTPALQEAAQRTVMLVPLRSVRVPGNSLVKIAREGLKPPPAESGPTEAITGMRKREPPPRDVTLALSREPTPAAEAAEEQTSDEDQKPPVSPATWLRIGLFVVVLVVLVAVRYSLNRRHSSAPVATPVTPAQAEPAKPVTVASAPANPPVTASVNPAQLDDIFGDGPTYVFTPVNLNSFALPIDAIIRLQNLIQRFDLLETRPADIQMSINTDEWGSTAGAPLTVNSRQGQALTAQSPTGLECAMDYSSWKNDSHNPVLMHASFVTPPAAFSLHFAFSGAEHGEPFRLLFVNENKGPAPVHLGMSWLTGAGGGLSGSLQAALARRLLGSFILPPGRQWLLEPFVPSPDGRQTNYLYLGWPADELPPPGEELDFAAIRQRLKARVAPLVAQAASLSQKLDAQTKEAGLDYRLGTDLGLTNRHLASLSSYSAQPSPGRFVDYLNDLKKKTGTKNWPRLFEDDDDNELASKFQQLQNIWPRPIPTNYFAATWQQLKELDKIRQEKARAQDYIDKVQGRLSVIPDTPEQAAYVGLFIIDPPRAGLEVIRFEGP